MQCPKSFTPGNDSVPIVQEAGWDPGLVCKFAENVARTRTRFPARNESLPRLRKIPTPRTQKLLSHKVFFFNFTLPHVEFVVKTVVEISQSIRPLVANHHSANTRLFTPHSPYGVDKQVLYHIL
jgi:hypothetical protein